MTRCNKCGISKIASAFGYQKRKDNTFYLRAECKECRAKDRKIRYQQYTNEQKLRIREQSLKKLYGITLSQYNQMFEDQNGLCPGCKKHQIEFSKALTVDHDHETKKVRGLLCSGCNLAIGNIKENPHTLHNLADYLRKHK